jgi:hypothetical protein
MERRLLALQLALEGYRYLGVVPYPANDIHGIDCPKCQARVRYTIWEHYHYTARVCCECGSVNIGDEYELGENGWRLATED